MSFPGPPPRLADRLELVEPGPQPDRLITPAELTPLSPDSPPQHLAVQLCPPGLALRGGVYQQASLSFSC